MKRKKIQELIYNLVFKANLPFPYKKVFVKAISKRQKKLFLFIREQHKNQVRKGGEKYINHLIRVGEMAANTSGVYYGREIGWSHDLFEDQLRDINGISGKVLFFRAKLATFGYSSREARLITNGVLDLTDQFTKSNYPTLNRKARKAREVLRLSGISANSQSIKYCDLYDNTTSIMLLDRGFAPTYLKEKATLLKLLKSGDSTVRCSCWEMLYDGFVNLDIIKH